MRSCSRRSVKMPTEPTGVLALVDERGRERDRDAARRSRRAMLGAAAPRGGRRPARISRMIFVRDARRGRARARSCRRRSAPGIAVDALGGAVEEQDAPVMSAVMMASTEVSMTRSRKSFVLTSSASMARSAVTSRKRAEDGALLAEDGAEADAEDERARPSCGVMLDVDVLREAALREADAELVRERRVLARRRGRRARRPRELVLGVAGDLARARVREEEAARRRR